MDIIGRNFMSITSGSSRVNDEPQEKSSCKRVRLCVFLLINLIFSLSIILNFERKTFGPKVFRTFFAL